MAFEIANSTKKGSQRGDELAGSLEAIQTCPFCGSALDGAELDRLGSAAELLAEGHWLRQQGVLTEAMHVAVKIVRSMNENPMWFKELLEESNESTLRKLRELIRNDLITGEIRPIQQALAELRGSPQLAGRLTEVAIAKRLSAVSRGDSFTTEKSTKGGEDVLCEVRENKALVGRIVVESKATKRWKNSFVDQIKEYMRREGTNFGIIATTAMPDDSLSYAGWVDGVLVVKVEHLEPAYLFARSFLVMSRRLEQEYSAKLQRLEVREQVMRKLRETVTDGRLDEVIEGIHGHVAKIEDAANKAENYLVNTLLAGIRRSTGKIRELAAKLVNEYIEKIRLQLEGDLSAGGSGRKKRRSGGGAE